MTRQCALVTGASAGLGAEFARQLAAAGNNLILVARRKSALDTIAQSCAEEFGVEVDVISADLSLPDATSEVFAEVRRRGLDVHYLINNAGAYGPDLLEDRDWPMVAGLVSLAGDTGYGPYKAYLIALSKGLAATLASHGVNVMALCPGFTHTEFHTVDELAKMKRGSPSFLWYDADVVVREGLVALEKGKIVYVSGRLYRYLVPLLGTRFGLWAMRRMGVRRDY